MVAFSASSSVFTLFIFFFAYQYHHCSPQILNHLSPLRLGSPDSPAIRFHNSFIFIINYINYCEWVSWYCPLSAYTGLIYSIQKIGLIMIFFAVRDLINNMEFSLYCFTQVLKSILLVKLKYIKRTIIKIYLLCLL